MMATPSNGEPDAVLATRLSDLFYNWGGLDIDGYICIEDSAEDFLDLNEDGARLAGLLHWTAADLANDYKKRP